MDATDPRPGIPLGVCQGGDVLGWEGLCAEGGGGSQARWCCSIEATQPTTMVILSGVSYRAAASQRLDQASEILEKTRALWTGSRRDVDCMWELCLEQSRHAPSIHEMLRALTKEKGQTAVTEGEMRRYRAGQVIPVPALPEGVRFGEDHILVIIEGTAKVSLAARALLLS